MHFFCPSCWNEVNEKEIVCPFCKVRLNELDNEPFVNKLLRALHHPEPQTVVRVIQILGEKHIPETIPWLTDMLIKSDNPFFQEALIIAICKFNDPKNYEFIKQFKGEEYSVIVRNAAENCLK